jgi:pimeloyl-ACP methyl ester carboxylesterase
MKEILMRLLLALPFLVLAPYAIYSAVKYTRLITNIFIGLVYRPSPDSVDAVRGERITILDSSDREIQALYLECKKSDRVMIFCHESGSTKESWEKYAYFFPALGYHVLSVDLGDQPADESERNALVQWPCEKEVEQLLTVIRWTKHAISMKARVVLFGISNGADLALAASFRDPAVEAVIADGLFSMKEIFRDYIRRWAPMLVRPNLFGERYPDWVVRLFATLGFWHCQRRARQKFVDVENLLRQKHVPLLMIHGEEDDYVPKDHQKYLEKLEGRKSAGRFVVEKARHNEAIVHSPAGYEHQVRSFLEKAIR